jgi:hypothetical protein
VERVLQRLKKRALSFALDRWSYFLDVIGSQCSVLLRLKQKSLLLFFPSFFGLWLAFVRNEKLDRMFSSRNKISVLNYFFDIWTTCHLENCRLNQSLSDGLQRMKKGMKNLYMIRINRLVSRKNSALSACRFCFMWKISAMDSYSARLSVELKEKTALENFRKEKLSSKFLKGIELKEPNVMPSESNQLSVAGLKGNSSTRITPTLDSLESTKSSVRAAGISAVEKQEKYELYLLEQASTWLKLAWRQKNGSPSLDTIFALQWKKEDDSVWNSVAESIPIPRVRLEHLRPDTPYTFRVRTRLGAGGWSEFGDATTFSTLPLEEISSSLPQSSHQSALPNDMVLKHGSKWATMVAELRLHCTNPNCSKTDQPATSGIGLRIRFGLKTVCCF